jgi:hypothetical protein
MNTFEEKKFTLEMIAFSTVDGQFTNENMISYCQRVTDK